jgi:hypothetical protein
MAKKRIWLTWLPSDEGSPTPDSTIQMLKQYGLEVVGSRWVGDLEKMAWSELSTTLLDPPKADVWLVAGRETDAAAERNRYALSLSSTVLYEGRPALPIVFLGLDFVPHADRMPTLTRSFEFLTAEAKDWPAKVVAAAFRKAETGPRDFRFNVIAHPLIGQWFEVGPREGEWPGVMLGVSGDARILNHAVGHRGELPERTVLEFPTEGIKARIGDTEFTACSVQNRLGLDDSYFVRVQGFPQKLIFGGHPGDHEAEVVVLDLE